jgi:Ca-activated chloride channel family protein
MRFEPLIPWPVIAGAGVVAVVFVVLRIRRGVPAGALGRSVAMIVLALAVAAGPAVAGGRSEARRRAADVLFVVDGTSSMAAEDFDGAHPRLDGVRADILELAAAFPGAHFSLVRFAAQGRIELPWTTDVAALETAVGVIRQERAVYSRGSRLDVPLAAIDQQIPRSAPVDDERYTVVFFFSDGEETAPTETAGPALTQQAADLMGETGEATEPAASSFAELATSVDGGAVLGYGTDEGAPMLEFFGRDAVAQVGEDSYVRDYSTEMPAISRIDESNLNAIAEDLGVAYVHRTETGGLGALAASIADDASTAGAGEREALRRLYWIPALGLVAVVLWQVVRTGAEIGSTRRALAPVRPGRAT